MPSNFIKQLGISVGGGHRVSSKRVPHRYLYYCKVRKGAMYNIPIYYILYSITTK